MQAIIITAYRDPDMLCRICEKFDRDKYRIFIHIDKRYVRDFDIKRLSARGNIEIFSKYRVTWGSIKHLYAIIALMKRALAYEDVKYIHIISGQDYPIADLSGAEEDGNIYLDFASVPEERYKQYNICQIFDQKNRITEHIYRGSVKLQKAAGIERSGLAYYKRVYKGTIWSSMPSAAAEYAVKTALGKGGKLIKALYTTYLPEEFFFQTIFMNSSIWQGKVVRGNRRYDDWTERDGDSSVPVTLDERDYDRITGSDTWFARKLDSNISYRLLNMLDKKGEQPEKALISIVITTCNRSTEILKRAVKSAVNQTYGNKEIIVINDAVGNEGIIKNALDRFPEVRFVQNTGKHGVSNVRNMAVNEAQGKYLAFLDDDDEWLPEKLELQYETADDDTGLVYCDFYAIKDGKILRSDDNKKYPKGDVFSKLLGSNFIGGCSIPLIKKEALLRVGKFDTNISFGEDYDMWLRIAKEYKVGCVPRRLMKYYIGKESLTQSFERRMDGWEYLLDKYSGDFEKYPDAYREFTSTNVREAAKRASLKNSAGVWKKYGNTGEYIKGIIMRVLRVY